MEFLLTFLYSPIRQDIKVDELVENRKEDQKSFEKILAGMKKNHSVDFFHFFADFLKEEREIETIKNSIHHVIIPTNIISPFEDRRMFENNQHNFLIPGYDKTANRVYIFDPLLDESYLFQTLCFLPSLTDLKFLVLNNISIKIDLLFILLARVLGSLVNLNELGINNCEFPQFNGEETSFSALAISLKMIDDLKVFSFVNNKVNNKYLADELGKFYSLEMWKNLEVFKLGWVGKQKTKGKTVSYPTLTYIQNHFENIYSQISNINSSYDTVATIEPNYLIDQFLGFRNLKELHLNDLENIKVSSFGDLLESIESLIFLDLSSSKLGETHINYALEHVNEKRNIEVLILNNNVLGNSGFWNLIRLACNRFQNLKTLSVENNSIQTVPTYSLDLVLNRLEKISLSYNNFENQLSLFKFLKINNKYLNCIILKGCGLNEEFLDRISEMCNNNTVFINLKKNGIADSKRKHKELRKKYKSFFRSTANFEKSCIVVDYPRKRRS